MNNIEEYTEKTFESIKHIDEYGNEFWEARELIGALIDKIIIDKDRNIEIIYKFSMLNA